MPPEDPNKPYIESPDVLDRPSDEEASGLFCFIDASRLCSAECMAFVGVRPEGKDYEGQQWAKCTLLVNLHRAGKHLVVIAGMGDSLLKHLRVRQADNVRSAQPLPQVPR